LTILSPTRNPPTTSVRRPLVLCYHAVSPTWEHRLCIQPDLLLRQVGVLARFRRVRATFDDAFRSAARVFPALEQMGVPLQLFVCTGYARDGAPLTIPELEGDDPEELATMSWDELRAHAERGVEVGSHGVSHPRLTQLSDDEVRRELRDSKEQIEGELGRPCVDFAYPYGEHDGRVRGLVRAAGYERAYGLTDGDGDPFALHRLDLYRRHTPVRALLRLYM
jgi:peptidoglycan/xylan/chitin deacetylase (PgdA/CDA1 family)